MAIEAKVIRIISETAILINVGWLSGVNRGDEFRIVQRGDEIFDTETEESLGYFDYIKTKLEVTEVFENFSQLQSVTTSTAISRSLSSMIGQLSHLSTQQSVTTYNELDVNAEDITPLTKNTNFDKTILLNDIATKIDK